MRSFTSSEPVGIVLVRMAYWLIKALLRPVLRFFFRVRVEGLEHVPADGAAILASNHLAVLDSFFLPLVLPRRMTFVAKAEYFDDPRTAWFFRALGQIPIKRDGGSASQRALEAAREVLERGELFGIYPEGTRSADGMLHKGHTGVARLALQSNTAVLAVAMIGTREVQPIGRALPNLFRTVTIRISPPMTWEWQVGAVGAASDPKMLRQVTDEVMFEIRELSGQAYVDTYAVRGAVAAAEPTHVTTAADVLFSGNGTSLAAAAAAS